MECDEQACHWSSTFMFGAGMWLHSIYISSFQIWKKHYHINNSLGSVMEIPQTRNPVFPGNHVRKCPRIHFGSRYFFQCHNCFCSDDAPRLAFDPNELWNMIVWTASAEIQEVLARVPKSAATMVPFHQGSRIPTWTLAGVALGAKGQQ